MHREKSTSAPPTGAGGALEQLLMAELDLRQGRRVDLLAQVPPRMRERPGARRRANVVARLATGDVENFFVAEFANFDGHELLPKCWVNAPRYAAGVDGWRSDTGGTDAPAGERT